MEPKQYWQKFYRKFDVTNPSSFAIFVHDYFKKIQGDSDISLLELGCGNGRDSFYLSNHGFNVTGVDFASKLKNKDNFIFIKLDMKDLMQQYSCTQSIVYSRFVLHAIPDDLILELLDWANNYFVAEFRANDDMPSLYPNHYRNLINGNWFLQEMIQRGFQIRYFQKDIDLAPLHDENPMIIRVIGKK